MDTCRRGHPFDDANTYVPRVGNRMCRECARLRDRSRRSGAPLPARVTAETFNCGHPRDAEHSYTAPKSGQVMCRPCSNARSRAYWAAHRPEPTAPRETCKRGHVRVAGARACRECRNARNLETGRTKTTRDTFQCGHPKTEAFAKRFRRGDRTYMTCRMCLAARRATLPRRADRYRDRRAVVDRLVATYGDACYLCGVTVRREGNRDDPLLATIDHVIPRSKGGPDDFGNLMLACQGCNLSKATRFVFEGVDPERAPEPVRAAIAWWRAEEAA